MSEVNDDIVRGLLSAIEKDAGLSQRKLSSDLGIAVGSVNWYLKRCISKGLIKLKEAPVKRYLYYLTPKGFEEKARLTSRYLHISFELYRNGRTEFGGFFRECARRGRTRIYLAGFSDLAEIAVLSCIDTPISICALIDGSCSAEKCSGVAVYSDLSEAIQTTNAAPDAIIVTCLQDPQAAHDEMTRQAEVIGLPPEIVFTPQLLGGTWHVADPVSQ